MKPFVQYSLALALVTMLSACDWVDSTGQQVPADDALGNANSLQIISDGESMVLMEEIPTTARLRGDDANLRNWQWLADGEGNPDACEGVAGFDASIAKSSLRDACTDAEQCQLQINEQSNQSTTEFSVRLPRLVSPVAARYQLSTFDDQGQTRQRYQTLCGISLNEAPIVNDDFYLAIRDSIRIVDAGDADALLANDTDDEDARNRPLQVITDTIQSPQYAAEFSLDSNGGFFYLPDDSIPVTENGFIDDKFIYSVTDGLHVVNATATIRIVDGNRSPLRTRRIPNLSLTATEDDNLQFDLTEYFEDPDNDPLVFSANDSTLPDGGSVQVSAAGILSIEPNRQDAGRWRITVFASDGIDRASDIFILEIEEEDNATPVARDISNRIVQNSFVYDIRPFFSDADDDELQYSAEGLPQNVSISQSGIIRGTSQQVNRGSWFVVVTADDGRGGVTSDGFLLLID